MDYFGRDDVIPMWVADMDFRTAVAQSSNVYFAKAIWERYADNKERYSDFMKKLHLDQTVGLEAFGEKKPLFQDWKEVPDPNSMLVRRSFGYRIKLSPRAAGPDPDDYLLQRHSQRRQDDLADSGPGAASGRGRGQALQNPDSRG